MELKKKSWQEYSYYPRILNREIKEGYKTILEHIDNYSTAGDRVIENLLNSKPVEIGLYRNRLLSNIHYYEDNTCQYSEKFDKFDMSIFRNIFISLIKEKGNQGITRTFDILDFGCGTGRDTIKFIENKFIVTPIDASPAMLCLCRNKIRDFIRENKDIDQEASDLAEESLSRCLELTFDEISFRHEFDGIWASASFVHIPHSQINKIISNLFFTLKTNGVLFASFLYGRDESKSDQRYFYRYNKKDIKTFFRNMPNAKIKRIWISDARGNNLKMVSQCVTGFCKLLKINDKSLWMNILVTKEF